MKSRSISRPTHTTRTGRVVYDRPVHRFTLRDLMRIARGVEMTWDVVLLWDALQVIFQLLIDVMRAWMQLTPIGEVWWKLADTIYMWISSLWQNLKSGSSPPPKIKPPTLD